MSDSSFSNPGGYILRDEEIGPVVDQVVGNELEECGDASDLIRDRVIDRIKQHCHVAREIRERFEYYQGLNADPVLTLSNKPHWMLRYYKSLAVPFRGGPALASTARDLLLLLAVVAVGATYYSAADWGDLRLVRLLSISDAYAQVAIVGFNFVFLSMAAYLVFKGLIIHNQKV
jgi:hypothetical protein